MDESPIPTEARRPRAHHGLRAIAHPLAFVPETLEHAHHHERVYVIVFRKQDAQPPLEDREVLGAASIWQRWRGDTRRRDLEAEGRAHGELALYRDMAAE